MQEIIGENEGQIKLCNFYLNLESPIEAVFIQNIKCFTNVPNFLHLWSYNEEVLTLLLTFKTAVRCHVFSKIKRDSECFAFNEEQKTQERCNLKELKEHSPGAKTGGHFCILIHAWKLQN